MDNPFGSMMNNGERIVWPFSLKLLIGLAFWFISFSVFSLMGIGAARIFTGLSLQDMSGVAGGYFSPGMAAGLKIIQFFEDLGMFIVPALALPFIFFQKGPFAFIGLRKRPDIILAGLAVLLILCIQPLISFTGYLNSHLQFPASLKWLQQQVNDMENKNQALMKQFLNMRGVGDFLVNVFIVAILPAVAEELFFRGFLQKALQVWTRNGHIAVVLAALTFSFIHFEFYGFVPRFLLGLLMGYAYLWSGDLKLAMLIHFTNNFMDLCLSYFMKQGMEAPGAEQAPGLQEIFLLISSTIILAFLLRAFRMKARQNPDPSYESDQNEG